MKSSHYRIIIILLSILPFVSMFLTPQIPHTSDGEVQMPRMVAYFQALEDGHFPVRWAGNLNYGYGMPLFIFIYHTPFLISSLLLALQIPVTLAFKLLLVISFVGAGITMHMFSRAFFQNENKALIATLLYQFAPYHLTEIIVRGSVGGMFAYVFLPLVLLGLVKLHKSVATTHILLVMFATALMILSHNALALLFFGASVIFVFLHQKNRTSWIASVISLAGGLGLSAFYWMPALVERRYTYGDLFMKDIYLQHFPHPLSFALPNILDTQELVNSFISPFLGVVHIIVVVLLVIHLLRKKSADMRSIAYVMIISLPALFMMTTLSIPLWKAIPLLRQFQFPWRFLSIPVFSIALVGPTVLYPLIRKNNKLLLALVSLIVLPTFWLWTPPQGWDHVDESAVWNYPLNTTYFGETDVIWSEGPATKFPENRVEPIEGQSTISNLHITTDKLTFHASSPTDAKLVSHTQYFPGWRVYVNGEKTPIEFQDQNWRGMITFAVPKGESDITIQFGESTVRLISNIISLLTLFAAGVLILLQKPILKVIHNTQNEST